MTKVYQERKEGRKVKKERKGEGRCRKEDEKRLMKEGEGR